MENKALVRALLGTAMRGCPAVGGRTCPRCVEHNGVVWCLADLDSLYEVETFIDAALPKTCPFKGIVG